jgi:ATP-dependent helicase HrpA
MLSPELIGAELGRAMRRDRLRLRRQLRGLEREGKRDARWQERLARLAVELERSIKLRQTRHEDVPPIRYDDALPVCGMRREIAEAVRNHPVVIVCGETGSGKSTQLPKICLEMGRGVEALIGHTQPRRIAARSVAARIAEELDAPLGRDVGFKVRFAESTSDRTYIKLMTDGILLAELQSDPLLEQYDTIIVDEAHERSLNIDFLLGHLKRLLARRHDLKLIITSATIDVARFAEHFGSAAGPAPIVEVSGRMYPVETRWRPLEPDEDSDEPDVIRGVLSAIDELAWIDSGDMLIFMPTERDIHETAKALRGHALPGDRPGRTTEILPLYARLSLAEQQRVFQPHPHRRIVIATNVAESSLTVPGIRYVIDPGTARISRYAPRSKTQRLPIEPVSQASAEQRKGRCGRVGPGICIRLYSEEDFAGREPFTPPEIQRTNLAAVILQTKAFRLGDIKSFPFLDPPRPEAVRDGYKTLFELGALDEQERLTPIGRQLARLPCDPRIGRMIVAGHEEHCLAELLIIAAALEVQDPRERPLEKQQAADECHAQFFAEDSDFLGYLKLWDFFHALKQKLSRNQLRKACRQNFLSFNRMREWADVHRELMELAAEAGFRPGPRRGQYASIHQAILTGLLSSVAARGEGYEYTAAGGGKCQLWPGSSLFAKKPKWIVAAELVETTRRYLRVCARIDPRWIEPLAGHLVNRSYSELHWDGESGSAMAYERVSLFGLTIVPRRRVAYGPIDPATARQVFIQQGLVEGDLQHKPAFLVENEQLLQEMELLQVKLRRNDLLAGPWARYEFYDRRLPEDVYDARRLTRWLREEERREPRLLRMTQADLLGPETPAVPKEAFPDQIAMCAVALPVEYRFAPGADDDGLTLNVPLEAIGQLDPDRLGWLVPGLLEPKVLALIRALPKSLRRLFLPAVETARSVARQLAFGQGNLIQAVADALGRIAGQPIPRDAFQEDRLPDNLRMNVRVVGPDGKPLAAGRDLDTLRAQLGPLVPRSLAAVANPHWNRPGLRAWDFGELPRQVEIQRGAVAVTAYPALIDHQTDVELRLLDTPQRADQETRFGLRRLCLLAGQREVRSQVQWLPGLDKMLVYASGVPGLDLKEQMVELLADRAFVAELPMPRDRAAFDERLRVGRERVGLAVQEIVRVLGPLWEAYHRARLALEQSGAARWRHASDDVGRQLAELLRPDFLSTTPWFWLQQYPRYLQAIVARLERLPAGSLARDREATEEVRRLWAAYAQRAQQHSAREVFDPELVLYRWMLEEYRVSLFAQKLGTAVPVSAVRLERQWAKVGI